MPAGSGQVTLAGHSLFDLPRPEVERLRRRKVSYVAQSAAAAFNPFYRLGDQVTELAALELGKSRAERREMAVRLFRDLQLPEPETFGDCYPHQVSGGQLQRAMIAMALLNEPELIIFDEPTTALDVTTQLEVIRLIRKIIKDRGCGAIYISHDLAVVSQLADRPMVLRHGKIVETGATRDVIEAPQQDYTRALVANKTTSSGVPVAAATGPIVSVRGLAAGYGRVSTVQDIALDLSAGHVILDITGFSRYEVTGPRAEVWLDRIFACRLPKPGRARLAPMLRQDGRLKGDLTVLNWGAGRYWIMGSYYLREWHMRWFEDNMGEGISLRDISDIVTGFALAGPKSRAILQKLTHQDVSALPLLGCAEMDVGLLRTHVARMSITGELGYEINCGALEHATLRKLLLEAGAEFGVTEFGFSAGNALRLEKSFGIWSHEFTQGYTPAETGLDRFIDWEKSDFLGEAAARAAKATPSPGVLVTLAVDATDADCSGYEPIWSDGTLIGYVTSGGYGHTLGQSLALAMVDRAFAAEGTVLATHIVGAERRAVVIAASPYDAPGAAMRG